MQNRYSESRSYTRAESTAGNLYSADQPGSSQLKTGPVSKPKSSAFFGAASIVVKTGIIVLSVIGMGIKATAKLLIPARKKDTQYDATPQENEL